MKATHLKMHIYMSDITGCKNKSSIIHISGYALMLINQANYLEIYSACFGVTKVIVNVRIYVNLILKMDQITSVHGRGWLVNEHISKILHSVTPMVPTPPGLPGRTLGSNQCIIHRMMYDTSINV